MNLCSGQLPRIAQGCRACVWPDPALGVTPAVRLLEGLSSGESTPPLRR